MNCDKIIDLLMEDDSSFAEELESHLSACRRCRSLQDVLSPLRNFDTIGLEQGAASFSSKQPATSEAILIAKESAKRLQCADSPTSSTSRSTLSSLKYAAAFLAGVAASLGGIAVLRSEPIQQTHNVSSVCLWESEYDPQQNESEFVKSCVACHLVTH